MKKMIVFLLAIGLLLGFAQISKAEKTEFQTSFTNEFISILTKYVIMENAWLTVVDITKAATSETASILIDRNVYIHKIEQIDDNRFIFSGTGNDWDMSAVYILDVRSYDFSKLSFEVGEYLGEYLTLNEGMYFSFITDSTVSVRYWDYYGKPVKIAYFDEYLYVFFGHTEASAEGAGILTVSDNQATAYRIEGKNLSFVKKFSLPRFFSDIGFFIRNNDVVDCHYSKWFYKKK